MSSANFKLIRTAAASRGFLATARFSCSVVYLRIQKWNLLKSVRVCHKNRKNTAFFVARCRRRCNVLVIGESDNQDNVCGAVRRSLNHANLLGPPVYAASVHSHHRHSYSAAAVLAIVEMSFRPSVRLSVTRWYCRLIRMIQVKFTKPSPRNSLRTLVFAGLVSFMQKFLSVRSERWH